ncbi:MAG TPA: hypothetical protein VHY91_17415 [Pirellulales bacterium]|jgi:hypothetical protein|nr:hypothetical protein [Pirellulales bacterium]
MSHVLKYGARFFRVDIAEISSPDAPGKAEYASWCSEAFRELKDLPVQSLSRFIPGPPVATRAEALQHAHAWIKSTWDTQQARRTFQADKNMAVTYIVRLFRDDHAVDFEFADFTEAKSFARAAEKGIDVTKVGITNNESPQYLTVWERS